MKDAYFAGGCFWCISAFFYDLEGVDDVISGYSGGFIDNPSYEQVKKQETGHRETIKITYDENLVNYKDLLKVFFNNVDLFDPEGQFIDKGFSYTLAIFYNEDKEKEITLSLIKELEEKYNQKACIEVLPFKNFFEAEKYHQKFSQTHPEEFLEEMEKSGRLFDKDK